mgnify:FL=1
MGTIVRTVLKIAAVAVNFIPGIGQLASFAIMAGLSVASKLLAPKTPKIPSSQRDRLYSTIDPGTPRKIVLGGATALANDIRYEEWSGTNQEYLDRIVCVASHEVQSVDEIWIEDRQAWTLGGGVTSTFSGYLTVTIRTVGTSANTISINGGGTWGSAQRLTGCAYVHLRFKTTGNSKKAESPFASSIPQRTTFIGNGAKLYDPRLDTTAGGSGSQRSNDQTTWTWTSTTGNNPALQILYYLLGWKIGSKLAIGRGIPPARIDMASFIAAANICEESVSLSGGGTEQRYRSYGVVSEADSPSAVIEILLASCAGTLRDVGGQLSLSILYNDLASPVAAFTDTDVLDAFDWQAQRGLDESFNQVRGKRTDPSTNSLYQLVDYPAVTLTSPDGLERIHTFDLAMVQSASQAQRLAKQELQRAQYQGVFSADFKATAWKCQVGDVVTLTFSALGFSTKLFRVTGQTIRMNGVVSMTLQEENSAIYAWSAEETAAVTPAAPSVYNPINSPLIQGISAAALTIRYPTTIPTDPPIGSIYFNASAKQFRFEGTPVTTNGVTATSGANSITDSGWVEVQDTAIASAAGTANWSTITGNGKPVDNADVTAQSVPSLTVPSTLTITADYLGVVTDSLPIQLVCYRLLGTTNVDDTTTWSATFPSSITGTIDSASAGSTRGNIDITAATGSGSLGDIVVTAVRDGVTLTAKIAVTKNNAAAPSGGGAGATSATITSYTAVSSDSYGTVHGGPVTVRASATGNITVSGALSFTCTPKSTGVGNYGLSLKAQWRLVGGSFADITTEQAASSEATITDPFGDGILISTAGSISFSFQKTGLTNGSDYEFQILGHRTGSGTGSGNRTITGTTNVNQS